MPHLALSGVEFGGSKSLHGGNLKGKQNIAEELLLVNDSSLEWLKKLFREFQKNVWIAGTIRLADLDLVERMTALMLYRGPDDSGVYEDGEVCLGHRQLSILDLSEAGHQPMLSDAAQSVITFNGEIYNCRSFGWNHTYHQHCLAAKTPAAIASEQTLHRDS